jgi:hypothetical protein
MRGLRGWLAASLLLGLIVATSGCIIPGRIEEHMRLQGMVVDRPTGERLKDVTVQVLRLDKGNVEFERAKEVTGADGEFTDDFMYDYGATFFPVIFALTCPPTTPDPADCIVKVSKPGYRTLLVGWRGGKWWEMEKVPTGVYEPKGSIALGDGSRKRVNIYEFNHGALPVIPTYLYELPILRLSRAE